MTKKEAIENHRKMWLWIAIHTLREKRIVKKCEYLINTKYEYIDSDCFCCEYSEKCSMCPIIWDSEGEPSCIGLRSSYVRWRRAQDYKKAALYAYKISKLPERE